MCNFSEGYFDRGYAKGIKDKEAARAEGRAEGHAEGRAEGRAEGIIENMLSSIRNIMDGMSFSADQAMDLLKIPDSDKPKYLALLKQCISGSIR